MSEEPLRPRDEKDEKEEEKRRDQEEKEEKASGEKWRRDPLSAIVWATILVWAGLVLLADNLGWLSALPLEQMGAPGVELGGLQAWPVILLGVAAILVIEAIVRMTVAEYRRPVAGTLILAAILFAVSLGDLVNWDLIWPIVLIVFGVAILAGAFLRRR